MKILIADHTGTLAARALAFLSMWGYEVRIAKDGLAALDEARRWRPDALLAEVRLERMGGLALCAALAAGADTRATRVLLVGDAQDAYAQRRGLALGARAFLSTPVSLSKLQRRLQRIGEAIPSLPRRTPRR
jgi:CheY-like chemotaxis protein